MIINPSIFLLPCSNGLIFWNIESHRQYELTGDHLQRFTSLIDNIDLFSNTNPIDQALYEAEIIVDDMATSKSWGWDDLSRLFHLGTKNIPYKNTPTDEATWAMAYLNHCNAALQEAPPFDSDTLTSTPGVILVKPTTHTSVSKTLMRRSTSRIFSNQRIPLNHLSDILFYSLGFIEARTLPDSTELPDCLRRRRCSPSGGGLNATNGFVYVQNVEGLDAGIYHYDPIQHSLHLRSRTLPELGTLLSGQHFINTLPFGIFLTSSFDKLWWKYKHSRAYRMALIEVGHISQTFQLAATDLGLDTWLTGTFEECKIEPLINTNNPAEQILFFVGAGYGKGESTPRELASLIKL